jgi:AcrR family transcriptional regulator
MRKGLTEASVVACAAGLADRDGLDALTLGAVAAALDVRVPSLYNHVAGLAGLRRALALEGLRELGERLLTAVVGRAGDDALAGMAAAYRAYAREHPGVYEALQRAPAPGDAELAAAAEALLGTVLAVLSGYGLADDELIHAARGLRSALHGFAGLERAGGFAIDLDPDASFAWLVETLAAGMHRH